jgi:HD-like signal output (HDOD) protein
MAPTYELRCRHRKPLKVRMDLKSLIDHPSKLPTVPRVTQRVIASFGSEGVTVGEISQLIEADPVLSAKLLRLANSSYFQVSRSIETVEDAIRILGLAMVRNLVLADGMMCTYVNIPGIDLRQFWLYSLYTACTARWLAGHLNGNRDQVFTLGLMHGIGQLHMRSVAPAASVSLDRQAHVLSAERMRCETDALGFNFLNVSAALAGNWNLPPSLVDPLQYIADPLLATHFSLAAAMVHLSVWHARNTILDVPMEKASSHYPLAVGERLNISSSWVLPSTRALGNETIPRIPALYELTCGLEEMLK